MLLIIQIWIYLEQIPFLINEGWNTNNIINVVDTSSISNQNNNLIITKNKNSSPFNLSISENESFLLKNFDKVEFITSKDWTKRFPVNESNKSESESECLVINENLDILEFKFVLNGRYFTIGSIQRSNCDTPHENNIIRCS